MTVNYPASTSNTSGNNKPQKASTVAGSIRLPTTTNANASTSGLLRPTTRSVGPMSGYRSDLGREPVTIKCHLCDNDARTVTKQRWDGGACGWSIVCLFFCFPLSVLPCCVKSLRMTEHRCGHCRRIVGQTESMEEFGVWAVCFRGLNYNSHRGR